MIDYFEQLSQEEQEVTTEVIQILYRRHFCWRGSMTKGRGACVCAGVSDMQQASGILKGIL